ncbi:hypothetical protein COU62_00735 [Candidatus Pacearchaeota archaeon CG10_big_fil_rev_8_21_14_0_10_35_219]|nr:DUF424 family protein [Candidatus Pacearchaeota archaeon]OIO42746.1 MAG: hypothetical protein AUJ63_01875 [Candidatus Pacearchaeota archaeon CG1_02_35_32]PIO08212.1 MAG: hypothetical protein COU62_00735 [Candidatus Pacearchaeota archaeon CG10_big_fil_rev_8_21_14_0_10_35_219]PIY81722.1 MAG: hypothetical protein COY79_01030 [Candidatus Pacearchaeota archaeon CG_4_10_14_0_8_um_filter_35_169]PIZ80374.1 MAG: hypothetical protein COY00_01465 [Candidatus Pacearchaeota archaeon CG_4_10_14_0_2_um_fil
MICVKLHRSYRNIFAVCDSDLIGKAFHEGIKQLDCKESFFKDKEISKEEAIKVLKAQSTEDATFNIIGPNSIDAATKAGVINPNYIQKVQEIPFILVLL